MKNAWKRYYIKYALKSLYKDYGRPKGTPGAVFNMLVQVALWATNEVGYYWWLWMSYLYNMEASEEEQKLMVDILAAHI